MSDFLELNDFEKFAEERRIDSNKLLWQIPGLSLTAQSFLVGAALGLDSARGLRVGVAALAAILALATVQLLLRHRYRTRLFSNALDASREARGAEPIDEPDLFEAIADRREGPDGEAFRAFRGTKRHPQRWTAFATWTIVLGFFIVLDVAVAVTALVQA